MSRAETPRTLLTGLRLRQAYRKRFDITSDGERFLLIQPFSNNERFQIMEDFVDILPDENLQEELNLALIEKGAFQRFEEVLEKYPNRDEQWRRFRA